MRGRTVKSTVYLSLSPMGPKLNFYLFPLIRLTLKKGPTQKKLIRISVKNYFFFKFHCKLRELSNLNSVVLKNILSKLFVYLILLPIVGLYSKT